MPTNFPDGVSSFGVPILGSAGGLPSTGNFWFVDSGHANRGDTAAHGSRADRPFATLGYAITRATADNGDTILVMPGHAQTLTAAVAVNVAGLKIIGLGEGDSRPQFTVNFAGDGLNVTAANQLIANLYFNEMTDASATAMINIAAARVRVQSCHFDLGANDLECITITAAGDNAVLEDNQFLVTADGPDEAISIEGAADNLIIRRNLFNGGSTTNEWDAAAVNFNANTPLNCLLEDNTFVYGDATVGTANALKVSVGNRFARGARPKAGVPIDIYADSSGTTTDAGSAEAPTTLVDAINLAEAGDRVLLYPGLYTVTAALAADVANLTVRPVFYLPGQRPSNVEIANDTDDVNTMDITAAGVTLEGLFFTKGVNNTTDGTELLDVGADRFTLRDCIIDLEARTNADGVNIATGTKHSLIERCLFTDMATAKSYIAWAGSTMHVKENVFDCSAADGLCLEQIATPGDGSVIEHNKFISDGAAGVLMSWQAAPGRQLIVRNDVAYTGATGAPDLDVLGDDTDLDAGMFDNFQAAATPVGAGAAIDPSVT